ncbi:MAG: helix-turn-helix transcriptional regulator [Myxococcota bacterium]
MKKPVEQRLRELRDDLGWSQTAMAQRFGVSQAYIAALEGGKRKAGLRFALDLERFSMRWDRGPIAAEEWLRAA